jgi:DNA-binding NtrC family response regulator
LRNRIERGVALSEAEELTPADLFPERALEPPPNPQDASLGDALDIAARQAIEEALRRAAGNRGEAARLLGVSRTTLGKRMRDFGLGA